MATARSALSRARLHLDSGYMSRVLRALERDGLVTVGPGEDDRRVRTARPTAKGRAERDVLDRRSDALAQALLDPLDDRQRAQLVAAMVDVERLLTVALIRVVAVDPLHPDAVRCLQAYFSELTERLVGGFEEHQSRTYAPDEVRPPHGIVLVAYLDDRAIGSGSLER